MSSETGLSISTSRLFGAACKAADSGDASTVSDILAFVEDLLEQVETLHPEVVNALDISFLEDLSSAEPHRP